MDITHQTLLRSLTQPLSRDCLGSTWPRFKHYSAASSQLTSKFFLERKSAQHSCGSHILPLALHESTFQTCSRYGSSRFQLICFCGEAWKREIHGTKGSSWSPSFKVHSKYLISACLSDLTDSMTAIHIPKATLSFKARVIAFVHSHNHARKH